MKTKKIKSSELFRAENGKLITPFTMSIEDIISDGDDDKFTISCFLERNQKVLNLFFNQGNSEISLDYDEDEDIYIWTSPVFGYTEVDKLMNYFKNEKQSQYFDFINKGFSKAFIQNKYMELKPYIKIIIEGGDI